MKEHGFWIPLTILFVMRPERDETYRRLVLRAVGTVLGLVLATAIAEAFGGSEASSSIVLSLCAALAFGLLTVQYALFTAAITTYVVLLTDTLGEPASKPPASAWTAPKKGERRIEERSCRRAGESGAGLRRGRPARRSAPRSAS